MSEPAWTSEPACWSWPLPPLPQPSHRGALADWQAGRCAVCAAVVELVEDHDHVTGDTRGYLCYRCNTAEGARWSPPVFDLYRQRRPAAILGVLVRYGCFAQHPAQRSAEIAWEIAQENEALARWEREREETVAIVTALFGGPR